MFVSTEVGDKTESVSWKRQVFMWLGVVWFVFINVVFYWILVRERSDDVIRIWERFLSIFL